MQDTQPFELPWLQKPVNTKMMRKSRGLSKKSASKHVEAGGILKNGNDVEENNIKVWGGDHVDQENNNCQGSGAVERGCGGAPAPNYQDNTIFKSVT